MKPPEDMQQGELWAKLSEPKPSQLIDFPRKGPDGKPIGKIRIQVLSSAQHDMAKVAAHDKLKRLAERMGVKDIAGPDLQSPLLQDTLGDLVARELLCMACLSDKPGAGSEGDDDRPFYPRVFRDPEHLADSLSGDELAVLFAAYLQIQNRFGPFERTIATKEDEDAWIMRLAADIDPLAIASMPLPRLGEVTSSLGQRLYSISRLLRSQWQSLPPTLASDLESFCLDTSFFGGQLDDSGETQAHEVQSGSERSSESVGVPADRPITTEEAARFAERLKPRG